MKKFCNVFARMLLLTLSRFGCNSIKALTKGTRIISEPTSYRKVASSNTSRLEAHAGFFR